MARRHSRDVVHRWEGNPLITIDDLSFQCADICNAGAVKLGDEYLLLVTIQTLEGHYMIYPARASNGHHFEVGDNPLIEPAADEAFAVYEERGVLDPRITFLEGQYYIAYNAVGRHGYRVGLARTADFRSVERVAIVAEPDTKAGVLFPRKIGGRYARLERPWAGNSIWVSYSDDLEYWGWSDVIMSPRGGYWDNSRIGVATPPMEVDQGWLFVYYGIRETSAGPLFRLGAAILGKENPAEVVGRTNVPILSPREDYERLGDVGNLVFSCGAVIEPDGEMKLYYGAANSCICLATTTTQEIVAACTRSSREF